MILPALLLLASHITPAAPAVPFRQPQLAAAHGQVGMTFGGGSTIYFASSPDGGKTFGPPVRVAEVASLALGRHRGPRLAILPNALVISAVVNEKNEGEPQAGTLTSWRSLDHGKTWTRGGVINDVARSAREGLHAMVADASGNLFAAWLDLRSKGTKLYGASSKDGGATWSKNVEVYASPDGTICQCCDPSLAVDENGKLWVMWRNVIDGSRDLYVSSSTDGAHFSPAAKLGAGTWKLNACPMDGGGVAVDKGQVISAWRRDGSVFLTEGNEEKQVGTGKDVAIAHTTRGSYVAWNHGTGLEVLAPKANAPAPLATEGAFVNLIGLPDGSILAAWESHNAIETKQIN